MAERLSIVLVKPQAVLDWWGFSGASTSLLAKAYAFAQHFVVEPTEPLRERSRQVTKAPWWSARHWRGPAARVMAPDDVLPASVQLV